MPAPILVVSGEEYLVEFTNDSYEQLTGKSSEELFHRSAFESMPCASFGGISQVLAEVGRSGQAFRLREQPGPVESKDGAQAKYFDILFQPLKREDGVADDIMIVMTDVTDIVAARTKIEESEKVYEDFFEYNSLSVWLEDFTTLHDELEKLNQIHGAGLRDFLLYHPDEVYRLADLISVKDVNQASVRMYGAADKKELMQGLSRLFKEETLPIFVEELVAFVNKEESFEAEFPMETLGGKKLYCLVKIKFPVSEDYSSVLVSGFDVTRQRLAEQKIKESENQFRGTFENAAVGIAHVGIDGSWLRVNDRLCEIVGYDKEELTKLRFQDVTHPDDLNADLEQMYQLLDGVVQSYSMEKRYIRKDGSITWINLTGSLIRNEDGTPRFFIAVVEDINERKKVERSLRESEERFRALVTASSDVVFRMSADWSEMKELHGRGLLPDTEEPTTDWMEKYIGLADRAPMLEAINKAMQSKSIFELEHQVVQADGSLGWTFSRAVPILDDKGDIIEWFGAASDVTERHRTFVELKESEEEFRTMANSIQNLAWIADAEGWIYWYNERWYEYTGTNFKEMEGWGWQKVHHPDHLDHITEFVKAAWNDDKPFELMFPLRRFDGEYRWFLTRAFPVKNEEGKVYKWIGTNTDIDEQIERERELKLAKEQLELTFANVPSGIFLMNTEGQFLYVNELAARQLGYHTATELLKEKDVFKVRERVENFYEVFNAKGKPLSNREFSSAISIQTQQVAEVLSKHIHKETGAVQWLRSKSTPLFDEDGKMILILTTSTDVTAEQSFTENLGKEVEQRTKELVRSNEVLQRFAHIASHDLKEPVRKISTFISRLEEELKESLTPGTKAYFDRVYYSTERMFSLIDGILNYSKVDAERDSFAVVNLDRLLKGVEADLEVALLQKNGIITNDELPSIEGIEILLRQLFYNLIYNAIKFSKPDVPLKISVTHTVEERAQKQWVQICIADNGIGFEQEHAEKIFEIYARLHSRNVYEGTGIGLALCKKIVERHGGVIWAEGKPGEGANFFVKLPVRVG
ncbi:MAG TPA: PAS domain S-box protein [Flavisolibacter sp.]